MACLLLRKQRESRHGGNRGEQHRKQTQQGVNLESAGTPVLEFPPETRRREEEGDTGECHPRVEALEDLPASQSEGGDRACDEAHE